MPTGPFANFAVITHYSAVASTSVLFAVPTEAMHAQRGEGAVDEHGAVEGGGGQLSHETPHASCAVCVEPSSATPVAQDSSQN